MNDLILKAVGELAQAEVLLDQFKAELVKGSIDKVALKSTLDAATDKITLQLRFTIAQYIQG